MKRIALFSILLLIGMVALSAEPIEYIWSWRANDPAVKYYRYHTDVEEEWSVVDTKSFRTHFFFDRIEPHTFYIQQSYDGENWSETTEKTYTPIQEKKLDVIDEKYNQQSLSVVATLYQSYVEKSAPSGRADFMSAYSGGVEVNATQYYSPYFGLMAAGIANIAYRDIHFKDSEMFYDAFVGCSLRLIANKQIDFSLKAGVGAQFEEFNGKMNISPAVYGSVNGAIRLNKHFYLTISPAVIYVNPSLYDKTTKFNNMTFRELSVGIEIQQ